MTSEKGHDGHLFKDLGFKDVDTEITFQLQRFGMRFLPSYSLGTAAELSFSFLPLGLQRAEPNLRSVPFLPGVGRTLDRFASIRRRDADVLPSDFPRISPSRRYSADGLPAATQALPDDSRSRSDCVNY